MPLLVDRESKRKPLSVAIRTSGKGMQPRAQCVCRGNANHHASCSDTVLPPRALPLLRIQPEMKTMTDWVEERRIRNPPHAQAQVFRFSLPVVGTLEKCGQLG